MMPDEITLRYMDEGFDALAARAFELTDSEPEVAKRLLKASRVYEQTADRLRRRERAKAYPMRP
jgi:hypothetical protein